MQEELEIMRPLLEEAAKDTLLTMEQIKVGLPTESSLTLCKDAQHFKTSSGQPLALCTPFSSFISCLFT